MNDNWIFYAVFRRETKMSFLFLVKCEFVFSRMSSKLYLLIQMLEVSIYLSIFAKYNISKPLVAKLLFDNLKQ